MNVIGRLRAFIWRQSHNYRMMLLRSGGHAFFLNLRGNYDSIYTTLLGADPITLGSMNSLSGALDSLISMPSGWLLDLYNLKRVMGAGMAIFTLMLSMYALARDWTWIILALALSPITTALMFRSQEIMITNGLRDEDRAMGWGLNQIVVNVMGLISPIPAALLIERSGGLTVEGIRPVYYISLVGTSVLYIYVYLNLSHVAPQSRSAKGAFIQDFRDVFKGREGLKAWIVVGCLGSIVWGTLDPFTFLYAVRIKGADALTIGAMTTVSTLVAILFALPFSRIADSRGRKFSIYMMRPFLYAWLVLLVVAPNPIWLIVAWVFRGVTMGSAAWETLGMELVPAGQRGRWLGVTSTTGSLLRIPAPIIGGLLFTSFSPGLLFIVPLLIDLCIRMPIFVLKVPETLQKRPTES